jgi:hypothetical protein
MTKPSKHIMKTASEPSVVAPAADIDYKFGVGFIGGSANDVVDPIDKATTIQAVLQKSFLTELHQNFSR